MWYRWDELDKTIKDDILGYYVFVTTYPPTGFQYRWNEEGKVWDVRFIE